jgi:hypothetical protein
MFLNSVQNIKWSWSVVITYPSACTSYDVRKYFWTDVSNFPFTLLTILSEVTLISVRACSACFVITSAYAAVYLLNCRYPDIETSFRNYILLFINEFKILQLRYFSYLCRSLSLTVFFSWENIFFGHNTFFWSLVTYYSFQKCWRARGYVVGWGTMLQAGRWRARVPMRLGSFFNLPNPSSRTMTLGSTRPLTEMIIKNLPGG